MTTQRKFAPMTALLWIALALATAVVVVLGLALTKPATMRISRSAVIPAPAPVVFDIVDDFNRWGEFSPWDRRDPSMTRTLSGAKRGVGAVYEWKGNSKVGHGRMEILDSTTHSRVRIKLDFVAPFEAHNLSEFELAPEGEGTRVTWTMTGPNTLMGKVMDVFMSMDAMIGNDFEEGLRNLAAAAAKGK